MTMKLLLPALLLSFALSVSAQGLKTEFSLDGSWEIIFDHQNEGRSQKLHTNYGFERQSDKRAITIPSCWEEIEQDYEGVAYYRKKFTIPGSWEGKMVYVNFDAVNYVAEVWLNNHVIDYHEGGFTPFSFRIDKSVKFGQENVLTMRVVGPIILTDKVVDHMGRQETPQWRGGIAGGIWQSVSVNATGLVRVDDLFIETDIHKNIARFTLDIESNAIHTTQAEVSLVVTSPGGETVAQKMVEMKLSAGSNRDQWQVEIAQAQNWSPDNPFLYKARVEVRHNGAISDSWEHKFGMREFTIRDNRFYLNDEPVYLKATFFEGLYPTRIAYPDSREMAIREIKLAKEAGFNMIRPWRKPPPKMWLDLCDSIGMMTVGSLVVECMHRPVSTPYLAKWVELEVRESVLRDRNRTCVVQWELFNEANRPVLQQMMHSMSVLAQELDPSRLILDESGGTKGANMYLPYQDNPLRINDIHTYPGGQVNQEHYDRCLIIGKTLEEQDAMGLKGLRMPGRNVQPGLMSYLSELGYASWPDIVANNKAFKEANPLVPAAVSHHRLEAQLRGAFKVSGFDKVFPDLQEYCLEEQKIHGIANKRMIEATRANPDISGYCIHALTDGDWILGAAILDLWRFPKTHAYEMTKEANQPQIVSIRVLPRNLYAGQGGKIQVTGINDNADSKVEVTLKIETAKGGKVSSETFPTQLKNGVSQLYNEVLNTQNMQGAYVVKVSVRDASGRLLTSNHQTFDVFTEKQLKIPEVQVAVLDGGEDITAYLKNRGIDFVAFSEEIDLSVPVIVGMGKKGDQNFQNQVDEVKAFVEGGGYAIFLSVQGANLTWGAPNPDPRPEDANDDWQGSVPRVLKDMDVDRLPFHANMYTTSGNYISRNHIVTDHAVFKGLPVNTLMSGVYENVCATASICRPAEGELLAGVITYDQNKNMDIKQRHYNGIGDVLWAADVLMIEHGKGKMLFSTLKIKENLGKDPVAEMLLYNMIRLN
jgi:beta-galactosidase